MSIGTEKTNMRPDLPELESVELRIPIFLALAPVVYLSVLEWAIYKAYSVLGKLLISDARTYYVLLICLPVFVIINLWVVWSLLFNEYYWKSDENGLTARAILRKRSIPWADVDKVIYDRNDLKLITTTKKITVGPLRNDDGLYLACSIWQHLKRHLKADDSDLPDGADSLWDKIPDTLPREMEWINPKPAKIIFNALISFVVTVGISIGTYSVPGYKGNEAFIMPAFFTISIGIICGSILWQQLITARQFHLDGDRFEAVRAYSAIQASFSDITRVVCEMSILTLSIRRKKVQIPYDASDESSQKIILALIRVLRAHGHLKTTPIPDELRNPRVMPPVPSWESIKLGLTKSERVLISGFCSFPAFAVLLNWVISPKRTHSEAFFGFGLAVLAVIAYQAIRSYQITIDSEKFVKSCLMWSRSINWTDVAEYQIVTPKQRGPRQRLLKDSNGKVLMDVSFGIGTWSDRVRFNNYLDSILADKIKGYDDKRDWLAQPWEPGS